MKLEELHSVFTTAPQKHSIRTMIIKMRFASWSNAGLTIINWRNMIVAVAN